MELSWAASAAAQATLLAVLYLRGVALPRPAFTGWLALTLCSTAILATTGGPGHGAYRRVWLWTEPVLLAVLALATAEAFLARARRWGWKLGALGVSLVGFAAQASVVNAIMSTHANGWQRNVLILVSAKRALICLMAAHCLAAAFCFRYFPPGGSAGDTPVNVRRHHTLLTVYLAAQAAVMTAAGWLGQSSLGAVNLINLANSTVIYGIWAFALRRNGDAGSEPAIGPHAEKAEAEAARYLGSIERLWADRRSGREREGE